MGGSNKLHRPCLMGPLLCDYWHWRGKHWGHEVGFPLALLGLLLGDLWALVMVPPIPASCLFQSIKAQETGLCHQHFHAPALLEQKARMHQLQKYFFRHSPSITTLSLLCQPRAGTPHPSQTSVVPDAPPIPFSAALTIYTGLP